MEDVNMLRSLLIYLSKADWARQMISKWNFARRTASRFVSGERLEDAIQAIKVLNQKGINATLDHLGEHTNTSEAARNATQSIIEMVDGIEQGGVRSNISIKLTQIGLAVDQDLCLDNLRQILVYARQKNIFVRIDMEDSPWVDTTLGIYRQMRDQEGLDNCGVVIQAYLFRSEQDARKLAQDGSRIRLCKGAYKEPADVAFPQKSDVDANYDHLARILIDGAKNCGEIELSADGRVPPIPVIASHDPARLEFARSYAEKVGLPKKALEFQMLYGIRRELQEQISASGYPVRVYVPYGTEWYPYYMRRLAERPANVWFFISNYFRN
jgi:proline dehydrogenase